MPEEFRNNQKYETKLAELKQKAKRIGKPDIYLDSVIKEKMCREVPYRSLTKTQMCV